MHINLNMKIDLTYEILLALVRMHTTRGGSYNIRSTSGVEYMPIKSTEVSFFKNNNAKELLGILGWDRNKLIMNDFLYNQFVGVPSLLSNTDINNLYLFNTDSYIGLSKDCSGQRSIIIRMLYMIFGLNPYLNYSNAWGDSLCKKTFLKINFEADKLITNYRIAINKRKFENSEGQDGSGSDYDSRLHVLKRQLVIIEEALKTINSRFLVIAKRSNIKDLPHSEAGNLHYAPPNKEGHIRLQHLLNLWGGSIASYRNGVIKNNFPVPFEVKNNGVIKNNFPVPFEGKNKGREWFVSADECVDWLESKNISCELKYGHTDSDKNFYIFEEIFKKMGSDISIRKAKKYYEEYKFNS